MNKRFTISAVGLITAVLASTAWGFDIRGTKTEAQILLRSSIAPVILLNFKAQLSNDIGDLTSTDVLATWQNVGGVSPVPFKVLIPAGCFVANRGFPNRGFHVGDFRSCGVQMTFDLGLGPTALSIRDFEARVIPRRDGTLRFDMETSFMDNGQEAAVLGALGGAAVEIVIGSEMGTSLPTGIESVSGISPVPF